jgi:hypothetical protein
MPFTYHHDYMRRYNPKYKNKSRADVALDFTDIDLINIYIIAFIYFISEINQNELLSLNYKDLIKVKDTYDTCKKISKNDIYILKG